MADSEDEQDKPSENADGEQTDTGDLPEESDEPSDVGEETQDPEDDSGADATDEGGSTSNASRDGDGEAAGEETSEDSPDSDADEEGSEPEESTEASTDSEEPEKTEDVEQTESGDDEDSGTEGDEAYKPPSAESDADGGDEEQRDAESASESADRSERAETLHDTLRERRPDAPDARVESVLAGLDDLDDDYDVDELISAAVLAVDAGVELDAILEAGGEYERNEPGVAAFFDHPDDLLRAARVTRESPYDQFDAYSPFPIHGMDEAMGIGRSWIPWVTFSAGLFGLMCAIAMQFGMMTFDWPMIIGGKPFAPWPAFVPIMFELTVLIGGVTTGVVMLRAAGCFEPADVIDPGLTDDRFALWISGDDPEYDPRDVVEYVQKLEPVEVRTFTEET